MEGRRTISISSYIRDATSVPGSVTPVASATAEHAFSFAGLTSGLSDLRKPLLEGKLESIIRAKWVSFSIPFGRVCVFYCHLKTYCGPISETIQSPE